MHKLKNWILQNKLTAILLLIVAFFAAKFLFQIPIGVPTRVNNFNEMAVYDSSKGFAPSAGAPSVNLPTIGPGSGLRGGKATPQLEESNRMTVVNSQISVLVENVRNAINEVNEVTKRLDGYTVNSNLNSPDTGDFGNISVRVPIQNRDAMLEYLREFGVKVVSEQISSADVTDEYIDMESRLSTLNTTKARYEQIMESATGVDEILRVQQYIFQIQDEIDRLIGRRNYLEATAESSLITIYLSTDELALPYTPEDAWRPEVVFKMAVRSMLGFLQSLGTLLIYVGVYAVIWIPLLLIYKALKRYFTRKRTV